MLGMTQEVLLACERIAPYIRKTPLERSIGLSELLREEVYLKCENIQLTGSFKVRGAFNKLLSLSATERAQGVVTASSGNHGVAVAYGMAVLEITGKIFVPTTVPVTKIEKIRRYTEALECYATDCAKTEAYAYEYACDRGMTYISPYNDRQIISGQGSLGVEILNQLPVADIILVPVSGGGLISGIAAYVKSVSPQTVIIGCLPENSPVMARSVQANRIVDMVCQETLSDATIGGVVPDTMTLAMCQAWVDDYILVTEQEIKTAVQLLIEWHQYLIEGAGALPLAALLKTGARFEGKKVVLLLSGSNISLETLKKII